MEFASSSSSSSFLKSEPHFIYDVFINFGGEDIGTRFVSHLHSALLQAQVKTFINEGMKLEEHMRAIAGSKIAIIIFSKSYTESTCSLHELDKIIECHETFGQIVLPVFYEIDPFDVLEQKGDFGKALEEAARKSYSGEQLEHALSRWSRAITSATGLDVRDFEHDAEFVGLIVDYVEKLLHYRDMSITRFPVGLESHVERVIGCIENHSSKVCMLGIWGMGGSGKTTIAKAIYNRIYRTFIGNCILINLPERGKVIGGHFHKKEELLFDILKPKLKVPVVGMRRTMNMNELSRKKLLIVLDGVSDFSEVENLCGNREWFGQGTVIIITTRDERLLKLLEVDYVYKTDGMNENDSLELLNWHAFGKAKPIEEWNEFARNVVAYCGGLPLDLKNLGSLFFGRTVNECESLWSRNKCERRKSNMIYLNNQMEKDIFFDVCCFFIGKDRGYVTEILNSCGLRADIGITALIERGLIKVERNNKLDMHPLYRNMGREITRKIWPKEKRSRLCFQDDVKDVLNENAGTEAIQGLSLKLHSGSRDCFKAHAFKKMKKLRLLQLDHVQITGDYGYLPKQLRWICWQGFPSKYIPNNFHMEDVIAINLKHSNLQRVWKQHKVLRWLKFLNLSHSKFLRETPDFSGLPSLEKLILKDCPSLCKVHKSIGDLHKILLINLKDCTSLSNLPKKVYKLKSLRTLILSGCLKIEISEEDIAQLKSLITLVAENTTVKQVPFSIVSSKRIGYISLCGFEGLSNSIFLSTVTSIIRSWTSPTLTQFFVSLFCVDVENNNWLDLAPLHSGFANLRSVLVQCDTEFQLSKQVEAILAEDSVKFKESRIFKHHLRYSLTGVGSYNEFLNTLSDSVSEGLTSSESCDVSLPGDNHPYWLAHMGKGHSVSFTVPQDCDMKGLALCVVYLSSPEILATESLTSVLMVNYTKCTLHIHKHGTVMSFNDEDWHGIMSNLGSGDKMEIFVTFGHGLVVKNTAVYLICGESNDLEKDPAPKKNFLIRFIKKIVYFALFLTLYLIGCP